MNISTAHTNNESYPSKTDNIKMQNRTIESKSDLKEYLRCELPLYETTKAEWGG